MPTEPLGGPWLPSTDAFLATRPALPDDAARIAALRAALETILVQARDGVASPGAVGVLLGIAAVALSRDDDAVEGR